MDRILDRMKKSSNRRGDKPPVRRLERRDAAKHINSVAGSSDAVSSISFAEDVSVSTSSLMTRSLEFPDRTSFPIFGGDKGEMDRIYRSLGVSGPDDLAISFDAWEACKKRSSSDVINRFKSYDLSKSSSSGVAADSLDQDNTELTLGPRTSTRGSFEGWKWFFELLRQPLRSLSGGTSDDTVEFLSRLPSDKIEAILVNLNAANFFAITKNHNVNHFDCPVVRTSLKEHANKTASEKDVEKNLNPNYQSLPERYESEITERYHDDYKEDLFEKCLTTSDVGNLDRLVVSANEDAGKYFLLATVPGDTDRLLQLEDEEGKPWLFGFSYLNASYELTKGWSSYVKEKQLGAGDFVFFQRNRTDRSKLFIGCRKSGYGGAPPENDAHESFSSAVLNPTSPGTSNKRLELREKLKEVETPFQPKLPEHSITGSDPILVIYCGDNQDSEKTYFISYIFNELCLRGFAPLRYDIKKSTVTGNPKMLYISRVSIIIFSMNYAHSRECMDGFVAISDHLKANNIVPIPVFFKVSHSDVRGQSGSFEKAFTLLGNSVLASQVLKWRAAMIELTSINGYQYMKGDEVILAKNIVRDVCLLLSSETTVRLQLKRILSLLNCSQPSAPQTVGLWGMAGIGKTTITRDIFRTQAERYDVCYFLPDFHLMCQTKGLSYLRDEFILKIFGAEKVFIDACDTKLSFTRDRFLGKKVLIVLDGVSNARDAEVLVGGFGWFSGGHTIILTSRNRQVLVQCNAKEIYEIQKLSKPESLHLCCKFATKQNWKGRMPLISELVNYASGIPLVLRVLGSSLQNQCINDEKLHLRRLRQNPPIEIQDAFRISFNKLDDNETSIFLDLTCFFRGENKDHVVNILDGCGFLTDLGIYGLIDESLISLVDNKLEMPNIFQDAGRFVVCQEHEEAGKRSRLWDSNDIVDVLTNNSGTEAIEGISLDVSSLTFDLSSTVFERMFRLRLLKLHCPTSENHCKVCLPEGLHSLPDELRLLHWERYPLGSLPRNFNPKNLVELNMPHSKLTILWKGTKNLEKLKRIILTHSRQLTKFPRLSMARNLEHIDLEGCTNLVKVNSSIIHHHKLTFLSLKDCSRLRVMPSTVHLESLEILNLSGCSELEDLQDFSPNLKELYLAGTAIREIPSSLEDLTRLVTLDLENCERLQHLPPGISNLKAMMTLKLSGCSNLKSLPNLDALFLRHSQRINTKITMEESVPLNIHSAVHESRLDGAKTLLNLDKLQPRSDIYGSCFSRDAVEEFLPAFEYLSSNGIPQESWLHITIIPSPSSILHSLASRLYALVSLFLYNAYLVVIPEEICWPPLVMTLDLGGNSFSQIPKSTKELRKLHSLRLRHCKNLKSLPELPRSLVILNAHGCVSLESFPSSFEQFPRHYTFSNCFNLSPKVVRKYIGKALDNVEGMAKGLLQASQEQEHINAPAFSICIPASAGLHSSVNFQAGSSVRIQLNPGMLKTLSGFALSVVVEFGDNYRNTTGFGIKCICRKTRTDLSPRLERIFHCWGPKEPTIVQRDHMFVFGSVKMHHAEAINHDFLDDLVTFEFHPVNWVNQPLNDSCTVKRCGVYLITAATGNTSLSAKRPSSSMDSGEISSVEHVASPYKRCRFKRVIETVILSLRKRKREMNVSTVKILSKVKRLCRSYVGTGNCAVGPSCRFDHPTWPDVDMVKVIGKGSGVVHLVQHKWTGQYFALKVIQLNVEQPMRMEIAQELKINQSSQCPYLVTSYQSFFHKGAISLILEYMDGGSLEDFLKSVKTIPESYLSAIFKQVLQGLIYLHHDKRIIHRGLKPSNLLINHRGEVKITDFGMINTAGLTNTFVGTCTYMSPERIAGNMYGNKSDIWSLGLVVFECATGKFPYLPPDQEETWSSVYELMEAVLDKPPPALPSEIFSPELSSFISTCLQKDPNSRSSAKELMEHPFLKKYDNSGINLASYFTNATLKNPSGNNLKSTIRS